jgi:hypothetical protein
MVSEGPSRTNCKCEHFLQNKTHNGNTAAQPIAKRDTSAHCAAGALSVATYFDPRVDVCVTPGKFPSFQ